MGGAIFPPKFDCPHVSETSISANLSESSLECPCVTCNTTVKPWLCISCNQIHCLQENHMDEHSIAAGHPISLNIPDRKFWCIKCSSYVITPRLVDIRRSLFKGPPALHHKELIHGLRSKQYKHICVLTGAGISVAAGIPDFRTPGTGLYSRLTHLGLPYAEAVFELEFFRKNPRPFYEVTKGFLLPPEGSIHPTFAHTFIKELNNREMLLVNFTQNIDGLELTAGLPADKLVQAHGHMRTCRCIDCKKEYSMVDFLDHLQAHQIFYCKECNKDESTPIKANSEGDNIEHIGLIKPDIVFFGESLPEDYKQRQQELAQADLVLVMGTSLQVFPFAGLINLSPPEVPVVLINRENPGVDRDRFLFLEGDIQVVLKDLLHEVDHPTIKTIDNQSTGGKNSRSTNSKLRGETKNKSILSKKSKG